MTVSLIPPVSVQRACADGLAMFDAGYGGRGLMGDTIRWARIIASGKPINEEKLRKMPPWFARHAGDIKPNSKAMMRPGWVAWQLWGGAAGWKWAAGAVRKLNRVQARLS